MDIQAEDLYDASISRLRKKHREELQDLTLGTQPLRTLRFFGLAIVHYFQRVFAKTGWLLLLGSLAGTIGILFTTAEGLHERLVPGLLSYLQFGLWWLILGVASSIGLGSGLHTFVLYLGPHIALFTMKAVQCGRVDIKSAPYDTIQLNSGPSWLNRNCTAFGPPLFSSLQGSRVPLSSILPQVQLEAVLWGIGTALGELPPYFISRAASISDSKLEITKELNTSPAEDSTIITNHVKQLKQWLLSHSQYLNFFTILVLASVPNPLFDLAGIICGQFGVPFWKFFLSTLIGKAIIKTHVQTAFIILVCNYQLLDLIENELVRVLSFIPGLATTLTKLLAKLHIIRNKYMAPMTPVSNTKVKRWDLSFASIWNTVIWLVITNFFIKIVTATAQKFLKEQQEKELTTLTKNSSASNFSKSTSI